MDLTSLQQQLSSQADSSPPVDKWDPPFCGDMDMEIRHDGSWWYMGTPIGRHSLVKLFASVLKREDDKYFLVTPVEKIGIKVADVPLLVTRWRTADDHLVLETLTDDTLVVDEEHPIALRQDKVSGDRLPYVKVRRNLWARLHQNVFYQLVEQAEEIRGENETHLMINSGAHRFSLGSF